MPTHSVGATDVKSVSRGPAAERPAGRGTEYL